jgi:hypothetical protein
VTFNTLLESKINTLKENDLLKLQNQHIRLLKMEILKSVDTNNIVMSSKQIQEKFIEIVENKFKELV